MDNCIQFTEKEYIPCKNKKFKNFDNSENFVDEEFQSFVDKEFDSSNFKFPENYLEENENTSTFNVLPQQMFVSNYSNFHNNFQGLLVYHGLGSGKCMGINTPIVMFDGSIRMVQDIRVGDVLMGDDSRPRNVLSLGQGRDTMYMIKTSHGEKVICNSEHILCLMKNNVISEMTVKSYISMSQNIRNNFKLYRLGINFKLVSCPEDPYNVGKLHISDIPEVYKINNIGVRLQYLAGHIDASGKYDTINNVITLPEISEDMIYMCNSLGFGVYNNQLIAPSCTIRSKKYVFPLLKNVSVIDFEITQKPEDTYYGFTLDGNHRYLLGNFIITHNTCTSVLVGEAYKAYKEQKNLGSPVDNRIIVSVPPALKIPFEEELYKKLSSERDSCINNVLYKNKIVNYNVEDPDREKSMNLIKELSKSKDMTLGVKVKDTKETLKTTNIKNRNKRIDPALQLEVGKYWNIITHIGLINKLVNRQDNNDLGKLTKQLQRGGNLIIIDEIQNLISESGILYKKLIDTFRLYSHNNRIVVLSATPIYDRPFEIGLIMNILNPRVYFPTNQYEFNEMFMNETQIKNQDMFYWMCDGYVSYFSGGNPRNFPFKRIIEMYHLMNDNQQKAYFEVLEKESDMLKFNSKNKQIKNEEDVNKNFLMKSRQYSNIVFDSESKQLETLRRELSVYTKVDEKLNYIHAKYSTKFANIVNQVYNDKRTNLIFSDLRLHGVDALGVMFKSVGFEEITQLNIPSDISAFFNLPQKHRYTIWSGGILAANKDKFSTFVRTVFNDIRNKNGEYLKVILGTTSIMEGISFMNVRNVHLVNPWWNDSRIKQVIARAIRYKSHSKLPESERFVNVYKHYSILENYPNEGYNTVNAYLNSKDSIQSIINLGLSVESVDQRMNRRSNIKKNEALQFENILKSCSVDCKLNKPANLVQLEENFSPRYIIHNNRYMRDGYSIYYTNPSTGKFYHKYVNNVKIDIIDDISSVNSNIPYLEELGNIEFKEIIQNYITKSFYIFEDTEKVIYVSHDYILGEDINCQSLDFSSKTTIDKKFKNLKLLTTKYKTFSEQLSDYMYPVNEMYIDEDIQTQKIRSLVNSIPKNKLSTLLSYISKESRADITEKRDTIFTIIQLELKEYIPKMNNMVTESLDDNESEDIKSSIISTSGITNEEFENILKNAKELYSIFDSMDIDKLKLFIN